MLRKNNTLMKMKDISSFFYGEIKTYTQISRVLNVTKFKEKFNAA